MPLFPTFDWLKRAVRRTDPAQKGPLQRIFVDVSTIVRHDAQTGIQRVVRSICSQLGKTAMGDVTVHAVAATRRRPYSVVATDLLPQKNDVLRAAPLKLGPGDAFLGLDLSAHLLACHEPQLRRWRESGAEIAIVVYDLLPLSRPDWFNGKTSYHFRRWLDVVGRQATLALPISNTVQGDLAEFLNKHHPAAARGMATHVLPLSGDIGLFAHKAEPVTDRVAAAMQSRPAVLMVGTIEPRKGHAIALAAHRHAWAASSAEAPLLIIAGKPGWRTEPLQSELRALDLERDGVVWLDKVSDTRLDRLYRDCHGVLVASLGEGYCLPLHEALAYGKPVLARDLAVLRELATSNLTYFTRDDPASLGEALIRFTATSPAGAILPDSRGWADSVHFLLKTLSAAATHKSGR